MFLEKIKMRWFVLLICSTFLLCISEINICSAARTPLYDNVTFDEIVYQYNQSIVSFYDKIFESGEVSGTYVAKNKKKVGGDANGSLYNYELGGRKNQIVRFLTNERNEVLVIDVALHIQSPIMQNVKNNNNPAFASDMIMFLLLVSGAMFDLPKADYNAIVEGVKGMEFFNTGKTSIKFVNNNRKYFVEKYFDENIRAVRVEISAER
ncbi:hypothetical protein [Selenomonas sp. AB3002]|uniref:hypothetical protein n=1 Tax=Selenomonas sp. AB3002 TaxID=1392502 RepID=UPI0004973545